MTLYKRLSIVISFLLTILLATVLIIHFIQFKSYVKDKLYGNAQNMATILSSSFNVMDSNKTNMVQLANAIFNTNKYEAIEIDDANRMSLVSLYSKNNNINVPKWFINFVSMDPVIFTKRISHNKTIVGFVLVEPKKDDAYRQMYKIFIDTFLIFIVVGILGLLILYFVLKIVLKSFDGIRMQAEGVFRNQFIIQKDIPTILELKEITIVMNSMIKRVKEIFERNAEIMKKSQDSQYHDSLTKLYNRRYFQLRLSECLLSSDSRSRGVLVMIRINGVGEANRKIGHKQMDTFYINFADLLLETSKSVYEPTICRLNGTEIAMILPGVNKSVSKDIVTSLLQKTLFLKDSFQIRNEIYFSIGMIDYKRKEPFTKILSNLDYALSQSLIYHEDKITFFDRRESLTIYGKNDWRNIIISSLREKNIKPSITYVYDMKMNTQIISILTFDIFKKGLYNYKETDYMPMVLDLGIEEDIMEFKFSYLKGHKFDKEALAIGITGNILKESKNYLKFKNEILEIAKKTEETLLIEISEYDVVSIGRTIIENLRKELQKENIRFAINAFSANRGEYEYLRYLAPVYVKMYRDAYLDMEEVSKNTLLTLLASLDIKLIITEVKKEDFNELKSKAIRYVVLRQDSI